MSRSQIDSCRQTMSLRVNSPVSRFLRKYAVSGRELSGASSVPSRGSRCQSAERRDCHIHWFSRSRNCGKIWFGSNSSNRLKLSITDRIKSSCNWMSTAVGVAIAEALSAAADSSAVEPLPSVGALPA